MSLHTELSFLTTWRSFVMACGAVEAADKAVAQKAAEYFSKNLTGVVLELCKAGCRPVDNLFQFIVDSDDASVAVLVNDLSKEASEVHERIWLLQSELPSVDQEWKDNLLYRTCKLGALACTLLSVLSKRKQGGEDFGSARRFFHKDREF